MRVVLLSLLLVLLAGCSRRTVVMPAPPPIVPVPVPVVPAPLIRPVVPIPYPVPYPRPYRP